MLQPGLTYRLRVGRRIEVRCAPGVHLPWRAPYLCINPTYPLPEEEFFAQLYLYVRDREDLVRRVAAPQPWDQVPRAHVLSAPVSMRGLRQRSVVRRSSRSNGWKMCGKPPSTKEVFCHYHTRRRSRLHIDTPDVAVAGKVCVMILVPPCPHALHGREPSCILR